MELEETEISEIETKVNCNIDDDEPNYESEFREEQLGRNRMNSKFSGKNLFGKKLIIINFINFFLCGMAMNGCTTLGTRQLGTEQPIIKGVKLQS